MQLVWYSVNCNDQHLHNRFVWYAGPHPTPQWNQAVCNLDVKPKNMSIFADGVVHFLVWNKVSWSYCSFSALISEVMLYFTLRALSIRSDPYQELPFLNLDLFSSLYFPVFAVHGLPENCSIFHCPFILRPFVTTFSKSWWLMPWKPYIFWIHII